MGNKKKMIGPGHGINIQTENKPFDPDSKEVKDIVRRLAKGVNAQEILGMDLYHDLLDLGSEHKPLHDKMCVIVDTIREMHSDLADGSKMIGVTIPAILAAGGGGK